MEGNLLYVEVVSLLYKKTSLKNLICSERCDRIGLKEGFVFISYWAFEFAAMNHSCGSKDRIAASGKVERE